MQGTLKNLKTEEVFQINALVSRSSDTNWITIAKDDIDRFMLQHSQKNLYFLTVSRLYKDVPHLSFENFGYISEEAHQIKPGFGTCTFVEVSDNLKLFREKHDSTR